MPRKLDSVNVAVYDQVVEVTEDEWTAVLEPLKLKDPDRVETARKQILGVLVDFANARTSTIKAKPVREDRRDLRRLTKATASLAQTTSASDVIDLLETLRTENPVLHRRLNLLLPHKPLLAWSELLEQAENTIVAIGRQLAAAGEQLSVEFDAEKGPGQRPDRAGRAFADDMLFIWQEFTDFGSSPQPSRGGAPFQKFVAAAGKLVDPDFNGSQFAREAHEKYGLRQSSAKGAK